MCDIANYLNNNNSAHYKKRQQDQSYWRSYLPSTTQAIIVQVESILNPNDLHTQLL